MTSGFTGTSGNDTQSGTTAPDSFDYSQGGSDTLSGLGGDDTFTMGAAFDATDSIDGGAGNDIVNLAGNYSAGVVFGAATMINVETLNLAAGAGNFYNLTLNAATVTAGQQMVINGPNNGNAIQIDGSAVAGGLNIINSTGADTIIGGSGNDMFVSRGGNDTINGGGGLNRLGFGVPGLSHGVAVDLTLQGAAQNTTVGNMTLSNIQDVFGTNFTDTLIGDGNANTLQGNGGNDTINGGGGNDFIVIGGFANPLGLATAAVADGGVGNDTLSFYTAPQPAITTGLDFDLSIGAQASQLGTITQSNFENLQGTRFDDHLVGDGGDNILYGADGNDELSGGAGNDILYGDKLLAINVAVNLPVTTIFPEAPTLIDATIGGDDTLRGGAGDDILDGGAGNNAALYDDATSAVTVDLNLQGVAQAVGGGLGSDTLISIQSLLGGDFNDHLIGDGNDNILVGGKGDDVLTGGGGNDTLYGGNYPGDVEHPDTVAGHDILVGGAGDDALIGTPIAGSTAIASYADATSGVTVSLSVATAQAVGGGLGNDTLTNITGLIASAYNDNLTGNAGDNFFDFSVAPGGTDTADGLGGIDTAKFAGSVQNANVTQWLPDGVAVTLGTETATLHNIERVQFDEGTFVLGTSNADVMGAATGVTGFASGDGDDTITPGAGTFEISGGDGNDTVVLGGNMAAWSVSYVSGADAGVVLSTVGSIITLHDVEHIQFDDITALVGTDQGETLTGSPGNDAFIGWLGNDTINGADGIDTALFSGNRADYTISTPSNAAQAVTVAGPDGTDSLINVEYAQFADGIYQVNGLSYFGSSGSDSQTGTSFGDIFQYGQGGSDTLNGAGGNDGFFMGASFAPGDAIDGGPGNDTLIVSGNYSTGLTITGAMLTNVEALNLGAGFNYSIAVDNSFAAPTGFTVNGLALGLGNSLTFDGSASSVAFTLNGGGWNDILTGGSGNDTLKGGVGDNTLDGGAGSDTAVFANNYAQYTVTQAGGGFTVAGPDGTDTLTNIEFAQFADQTVSLVINNFAGTPGNDTFVGNANNNLFDFSIAPGGTDGADGGAGIDTAKLAGSLYDAAVTAWLPDGVTAIEGSETVTLHNIERVQFDDHTIALGTSGNDNFGSTPGVDGFGTGTGNDTIEPGAGTYEIFAGDGNDTVVLGGNRGDWTISAVSGDNPGFLLTKTGSAITIHDVEGVQFGDVKVFLGTPGNDSLIGDANNNLFDFSIAPGGSDVADGGAGIDTAIFAGSKYDPFDNSWSPDGVSATNGTETITLHNIERAQFNDGLLAIGTSGDDAMGPIAGITGYGSGWGNDTITPGAGTFEIFAGDGNDTVLLDGNLGAWMVSNVTTGGNNPGLLLTSPGSAITIHDVEQVKFDDVTAFVGTDGSDTLNGTNGNDAFIGGLGNDAINGGNGIDIAMFSGLHAAYTISVPTNVNQSVTISGPDGTDTLTSVEYAQFADGVYQINGLTYFGTSGNESQTGTDFPDIFNFGQGGHDTLNGGGGNDVFNLGPTFDTGDAIDGGTGNDVLNIGGGNYALTITGAMLSSVEMLNLGQNNSYNLTIDNSFAALAGFTVNAGGLGATNTLSFDGSASSVAFTVNSGAGNDTLSGSSGNDTLNGGDGDDTINIASGGNDAVHAGNGNDSIVAGNALTAADSIDGGAGTDTLTLSGTTSVVLGATTLTNVENLVLAGGGSYSITTDNATVAAGQILTVDGSALGAGTSLAFNGAAETDGAFTITSGAGNDTLTGGSGNDTLNGGDGADIIDISHGGNDTVNAGAGDDFIYAGLAYTASDAIDGGAGSDILVFDGLVVPNDVYPIITLGAVTNIETLWLDNAGYTITTTDATVGAGQTLTVDARLGAQDQGSGALYNMTFNGAAESDGNFVINTWSPYDTVITGAGNDTINLRYDGAVTVNGGGGNDTINAQSLAAGDAINGGAGTDTLALTGGGTVVLGATTMTNIENLVLSGGDYFLTTNNATIAAGQSLAVDATALGTTQDLNFNGSAETDGRFIITGGAGADVIYGGALADTLNGGDGSDTLNISSGGNDVANGGDGDDWIVAGAAFTAADSIDGGAGVDRLFLNGNYSGGVILGASTLLNVEIITLTAGNSYNLTTNDATVISGGNLTVDGHLLASGQSLIFNGGAETNGSFSLTGGAGNDTLTGGSGDDIFVLNSGGNDIVSAGGGNDTIGFGAAFTASDSVNGGSGIDTVMLNGISVPNYNLTLTMGASTLTNVENLILALGSYSITTNNATVAAGQTLTVDATESNSLTFNGAAETDGRFNILGSAGNDTIIISSGGNDTVNGGDGNDVINASAAFTAADSIDGGAGTDTLNLNGNYSAGVIFNAATLVNVETIKLAAGFSYSLTTNDATVAAGQSLSVDGSLLGSKAALTFDGHAETDGNFAITGGAGDDKLIGGAGNDTFDISKAGNDTVSAGGGADTINAGAAFTAADAIDGGAGIDTLTLTGGYNGLTFGATTLLNVENIQLTQGFSYKLTTTDATVAAGQSLTVDGSQLASSDVLTFVGSAETNGSFILKGGAGKDVLTAGTGADTLIGGGGIDTLMGGAGADTYKYLAVSDSTGANYDSIVGFDAASDKFWFPAAVNQIDASITTGALSAKTFDSDLALALAGHLFPNDAILLTSSSGKFSSHTFLVVDANGTAGYQANADYVIDVSGIVGNLSFANFDHP